MERKAWPFLVSRNKTFDYQPIVVPQQFFEKNASNVLAEAVGGDLSDPHSASYREIHSASIGDMSLIFRVVLAENRHIGLAGSQPLKDEAGRPIHLIEGVAVEGRKWKIVITKGDLQVAHESIEAAYRDFWHDTRRLPVVRPSHPFFLQAESDTSERLTLKQKSALDIRPYEVHDHNLPFHVRACAGWGYTLETVKRSFIHQHRT